MKFTTSVDLLGAKGFVRRLHADEATRLVRENKCIPVPVDRGKVQAIQIVASADSDGKPPTLTVRSYQGWRATYREQLNSGHLIQLKRIAKIDGPLFRLSQTENLAPFRADPMEGRQILA